MDELKQIPDLHGPRSAPFGSHVLGVVASIQELDYRHAQVGVVQFAGNLDSHRSLVVVEAIHRHLEAYLAELELLERVIHAVVFFIRTVTGRGAGS